MWNANKVCSARVLNYFLKTKLVKYWLQYSSKSKILDSNTSKILDEQSIIIHENTIHNN